MRHEQAVGFFLALAFSAIGGENFTSPTVQRGMIDSNSTFSHNFFQIWIRDAVTHVERYGIKDHAFEDVVPFEINHHGWALTFKSKSPHLT